MHMGRDLTIIVFLTTFPEACVEVSKGKLVFACLPDVVHCVGQLPLSNPGQLLSAGWRQCPVEGVLSWTLCVTTEEKKADESICCSFLHLLMQLHNHLLCMRMALVSG